MVARNLSWIRQYVRLRIAPYLRHQADSQDFVQDALVQVLESGPRFEIENEQHFRSLIARIVTNDIRDRHRYLHRQRRNVLRERPFGTESVLQLDPPAKAVTRPSQFMERNERQAWVRLAMEFLDPETRELVRLRIWQGQAFTAIGEALGVSEDAARMRFKRALAKLADRVVDLRSGGIAQILDEI